MIQLQRITAGYGGVPVLRDVSLAVFPGEVLILIGPNGSGKSTLLKTALGLLPPMAGQVFYDGEDIRSLDRKEIARRAAFLAQSRNTPSITAGRMVLHGRFPYISYPRSYRPEDYAAVERAMDTTGTRPFEKKNVNTLSGGQRQGVYLAMTLAQDTQTVFMDEPTTYLDISRQMQLIKTAKQLAEAGRAVVLVLHDLPLALQSADRLGVLSEGTLRIWDTPGRVYESGLLPEIFGVNIHAMDTPHGIRYYCTEREV